MRSLSEEEIRNCVIEEFSGPNKDYVKLKLIKIFLVIIILLGVIALILPIIGFNKVEDKISFLDKQLWDRYPGVMQESISNGYPLSSYIKDMIICVGLFKSCAVLFVILIITAIVIVFLINKREDTAVST